MEMHSEAFDAVAYEVEAHLRELRRLIGETLFLSDAQNEAVKALREELRAVEAHSSALRHSLLTGEDPQNVETKPVGEMGSVTTL
ncbi:MAG: hypothetical protein H8F28_01905 [Fibrella sp.]|nr:hypothetical protein [Armatimonadota bacterium]